MIFLMLVGLTHVSATASSQNAVLSLKLKDVSLEEAVRSAEKQLKQDFFFSKKEVDVTRKISVNLKRTKKTRTLPRVTPLIPVK